MLTVQLGDFSLIYAQATTAFGAGGADIVGDMRHVDACFSPIPRSQSAYNDGAHVGREGI